MALNGVAEVGGSSGGWGAKSLKSLGGTLGESGGGWVSNPLKSLAEVGGSVCPIYFVYRGLRACARPAPRETSGGVPDGIVSDSSRWPSIFCLWADLGRTQRAAGSFPSKLGQLNISRSASFSPVRQPVKSSAASDAESSRGQRNYEQPSRPQD